MEKEEVMEKIQKKSLQKKNSTRFNLYLNDEEKKILAQLKQEKGYTGNAIIRKLILNEYLNNTKNSNDVSEKLNYSLSMNQILFDNLYRIGSNINQIAHRLNLASYDTNEIHKGDLKEINAQIKELKMLLEEYKGIYKKSQKLHQKLQLPKKAKYHKGKDYV